MANQANYLNIPTLLDSCLEVIAIEMRKATDRAEKKSPSLTQVSKEEDAQLRAKYSWAYN